MAFPARFALLVAMISVMSLPVPHFRTAFPTAVALALIATDTDCEYGAASRLTQIRSRRTTFSSVFILPQEDYAIADGAELKLSVSATGTHRLLKRASPRQVQVTPRSNSNPKV
jgi:hypothetical protein